MEPENPMVNATAATLIAMMTATATISRMRSASTVPRLQENELFESSANACARYASPSLSQAIELTNHPIRMSCDIPSVDGTLISSPFRRAAALIARMRQRAPLKMKLM